MYPVNKLFLVLILVAALSGCSLCGDGISNPDPSLSQEISEQNDLVPIIPQIMPDTPTPANTPINHPLVTEHTPAPMNQPLKEATEIPPSTFVPNLIDDGVPDLIGSVNDLYFDGILEGSGVITFRESTIEALLDTGDRVLIAYRTPDLMTALRPRTLNGQISLNHSRTIAGIHKETKIYENGSLVFAHIDKFSNEPLRMAVTEDLSVVQSEVSTGTEQTIVNAPVVASTISQQNIPIPLNIPTVISNPVNSFEVYPQSSYLYQSDQPGSDAPTGYIMNVWIIKID